MMIRVIRVIGVIRVIRVIGVIRVIRGGLHDTVSLGSPIDPMPLHPCRVLSLNRTSPVVWILDLAGY